MNIAIAFARVFFFLLSILFMTLYMTSGTQAPLLHWCYGIGLGAVLGTALIGVDLLFKRFNLHSFNIAIVGLFFGYLMGQALVLVLSSILQMSASSVHLSTQTLEVLRITLFLFGLHLGTLMTLRSCNELSVSIPFVKFTPTAHKKKDLLIDYSALSDGRIVDLAASGLLDHHLIVPRFLLKDLYAQVETAEEVSKNRAKKSLEVVKKLEALPNLDLRYSDTDFPEVKDSTGKLIRLARFLDANFLTADSSRLQMASLEGIKLVDIHFLSTALKPLMQAGELIKIKVQRFGKEPRQGVGYLEDGTMVVINGGGEYMGEVIDAQVLSVKHTSSGRMIFCNALDAEGMEPAYHGEEHEEQ